MFCGLNSSNRYLQRIDRAIPSLTHNEVGSWSHVDDLTKALNDKISEVYKNSHEGRPVEKLTIQSDRNTNKISDQLRVSKQLYLQLNPEEIDNLKEFIVLRDGHYTVYEKNDAGLWEVSNDNRQSKALGMTDTISVIFGIFKDLAKDDAVTFILEKKFTKQSN